MRTDSVNIATVVGRSATHHGALRQDNIPAEARIYKTTAKNAQEAHEGIRPTSVARTPDSLRQFLNEEQFRPTT